MIDDLRKVSKGRMTSFINALEKNEKKLTEISSFYVSSWNTCFQDIRKPGEIGEYIPSVSLDLSKLCVYSENELRVYELSTQKLIKSISYQSDKEIKFANILNFLTVHTGDDFNIYTNDGIMLYSMILKDIKGIPKVFSSKDYLILDYEDSFLLIDPYYRSFKIIKKNKIYSFFGFNSEYDFISKGDSLIVVQIMRKIVHNGIITKTFIHMFDAGTSEGIVYIKKTSLNPMPQKTNHLFSTFVGKSKDDILLQPGTGDMYSLSEDAYKVQIICRSIKIEEKKETKFIGLFKFEDVEITLLYSDNHVIYCHRQSEKLKILFSIPIIGVSIKTILHSNILYMLCGKKINVFNMNTLLLSWIDLDQIKNIDFTSMKVNDNRIVIYSFDKNTREVSIDSSISLHQ